MKEYKIKDKTARKIWIKFYNSLEEFNKNYQQLPTSVFLPYRKNGNLYFDWEQTARANIKTIAKNAEIVRKLNDDFDVAMAELMIEIAKKEEKVEKEKRKLEKFYYKEIANYNTLITPKGVEVIDEV